MELLKITLEAFAESLLFKRNAFESKSDQITYGISAWAIIILAISVAVNLLISP